MAKKKILHFIHGLNIGGAETFLGNTLPNLDEEEYAFDFALQNPVITNERLKVFIADTGSKVYVLPSFPRHLCAQILRLRGLIEDGAYDYVHVHMNAAINPAPMIAWALSSKKAKFIAHSHNSSNNLGGAVGRFCHRVNRRFFKNNGVIRVACSQIAGDWMFNASQFGIINNAVDSHVFTFSDRKRIAIREKLGIGEDDIVLGSVARFVAAKNHEFMVEVFYEYLQTHPKARLLLVGEGPLKESIEEACRKAEITDNVIFMGLRTDVPELLSSMDLFLFPSYFEGLAFSAIEAQATGLSVLASGNIPRVVDMGCTRFLPLDGNVGVWAAEIDKAVRQTLETRSQNRNPVKGSKFDLDVMISELKELYTR